MLLTVSVVSFVEPNAGIELELDLDPVYTAVTEEAKKAWQEPRSKKKTDNISEKVIFVCRVIKDKLEIVLWFLQNLNLNFHGSIISHVQFYFIFESIFRETDNSTAKRDRKKPYNTTHHTQHTTHNNTHHTTHNKQQTTHNTQHTTHITHRDTADRRQTADRQTDRRQAADISDILLCDVSFLHILLEIIKYDFVTRASRSIAHRIATHRVTSSLD